MKQFILLVITSALILNAIFLGIIAFKGNFNFMSHSDLPKDSMSILEWRQHKAADVARHLISENLYYPNSYSLASLEVDSLFYNYMTDPKVVYEAVQLIEARSKINEVEKDVEQSTDFYLEAQNTLKIFGSSGVFWRHRKERDDALKNLNIDKVRLLNAKENFDSIQETLQKTLQSRDETNDGKFVGWQVYCRYRAKTNNGIISFGSAILYLDNKMQNCNFRYTINEGNKDYEDIKNTIKQTLESN